MRFFRLEIPLFIALMVSWVHCQECGNVTLTANSGTFMSPNYPKEYDHELDCTWTIQAPPNHFVRLTFGKNMDLKNPFFRCIADYVSVNSGTGEVKYCKDSPPTGDLMSDTDVMTVHLHTDDFFRNGNGFQATYDIVDKDGNPLDKPEEDDESEDETTEAVTESTTTSTKSTTTSTTMSTTAKTSKYTTTSVLITKLSKATTTSATTSASNDAGKTSGFVIGSIVVVVALVVCIICGIAFVRYRKNKNKRISLNVIATPDDKELINNGKIYKKIGNKDVREPEAETFPL